MKSLHDGTESVNTDYRIRLPQFPKLSFRKPAQHIRIYFNAGNGPKCWHVGIETKGQKGVDLLYSASSLIDAGDYAYTESRTRKMAVKAGEYSETLKSVWRRQGADCYKAGAAIDYCENTYRCQGWISEYNRDIQPLVMHGWPTAEAVAV